jgi:hypothetical protein
MPVTFTTNWRETLEPLTVEAIEAFLEQDFDLQAMLIFVDEHSEKDFRFFYDDYVRLGEEYGYEAVDAFINEVADVDDLGRFERAYIGEYSSPARMAEDYLSSEVDCLSYMIVVDWDLTAEYLLDHDVDRYGDYYFRCSY